MTNQARLREIDAAEEYGFILRNSFPAFFEKVMITLEPETIFKPNWHIDCIGEYLRAVEQRQFKRIIFNMPPRMLKSMIITVAWTAYRLGRNPHEKFICASYSSGLSIEHSLKTRTIMESDWFKIVFPDCQLRKDQNEKKYFMTTLNGFRESVSVGGTVTGKGANTIIWDDLINPMDAFSEAGRKTSNNFYDLTLSNRMNNPRQDVIVGVQQRLRPGDTTGHILEQAEKNGQLDDWEIVKLPMRAEEKTFIQIGTFQKTRKAGELLHDEHFGDQEEAREKAKGSMYYSAQYQQDPENLEGGMVKLEWWRYFNMTPQNVIKRRWSWDTAIKTKEVNDYTVGQYWIETPIGHFLVHQVKIKAEYPVVKQTLINEFNSMYADEVLIEDKASGQQLIQDLRVSTSMNIIGMMPGTDMPLDKVSRVHLTSQHIEAGNVYLPNNEPWVAEYVRNFAKFPEVRHDDEIDATTQYLSRVKNSAFGFTSGMIRALDEDDDEPLKEDLLW